MPRLSHTERRRQILETAMKLFADLGFHGTTTKRLAQAAGISEATIFLHFPTKQDLYDAILVEGMPEPPATETWLERVGGLSLRAALSAYAERALGELHRNPALVRLLVYTALEGHELAQRLYRKHLEDQFKGLAEVLRQAQRRGKVRKDVDCDAAALLFTTVITHAILVRQVFGARPLGRRALRARLDKYLDLYLEGILPSKSRR